MKDAPKEWLTCDQAEGKFANTPGKDIEIELADTNLFDPIVAFKLQPQSDVTVGDLASIFANLGFLVPAQAFAQGIPQVLRRHFAPVRQSQMPPQQR